MKKFLILSAIIIATLCTPTSAQMYLHDNVNIDADGSMRAIDKMPYFSIYKDNFFAIGTSLGSKPTNSNSDVKFQISFRQRLTKKPLQGNIFPFLMYSQKTLWNVFEESLPMHDLNFNPGIGLTKILTRGDRVVGNVTFLLEHESNGRDGEASRSWNKLSVSANVYATHNLMIHSKIWFPIIDGENNRDILRYSGIFNVGVQWLSTDKRYVASAIVTKRQGINLNANVTLQAGIRLFKNSNQFLFVEYYNGYGECLLDYNKFHSRIRAGLLIRPQLFSEF